MRLHECMNWIAKASGIANPINGYFSRTLDCILKTMPAEVLDDYVDMLNTVITIIPYNDDGLVEFQRSSVFTGSSPIVDGQSTLQYRVFLLCDYKEQLFEPIYVRLADNSEKFRFDDAEKENICKDVTDFIEQRNRQSEFKQFSNSSLNR